MSATRDCKHGRLARSCEICEMQADRDQALDALERLHRNAEYIFNKKPVRDWDETLHESASVLRLHHRLEER